MRKFQREFLPTSSRLFFGFSLHYEAFAEVVQGAVTGHSTAASEQNLQLTTLQTQLKQVRKCLSVSCRLLKSLDVRFSECFFVLVRPWSVSLSFGQASLVRSILVRRLLFVAPFSGASLEIIV